MLKSIVLPLLAILLLNPVSISAGLNEVEKKTYEELAKDLTELNELVVKLQQALEKLTPEEKRQWCKNLHEKMEKNPPPIPIQLNCD